MKQIKWTTFSESMYYKKPLKWNKMCFQKLMGIKVPFAQRHWSLSKKPKKFRTTRMKMGQHA